MTPMSPISIKPKKSPLALGLDPGFASIGIAVADLFEHHAYTMRVFRTSKTKSSKAAEDNVQRTFDISRMLYSLYQEFPQIKVICAEAMSFPPNSSVASKMSMCWGVICSFAERNDLAIVQLGPQEIKRRVCGNKAASKEEVQAAITRLFSPQDLTSLHSALPKGQLEHTYDALASIEASRNSSEFKLIRAVSGG